MRTILRTGLALTALLSQTASASPQSAPSQNAKSSCASEEATIAHWQSVRAQARTADPNQHALDLARCLKSPNPLLRDRIAYEVLTFWLRGDKLTPATRAGLENLLLPWLSLGAGTQGTDQALARAFSALILSEVVRADSASRTWTVEDLNSVTRQAADMFVRERDYRGLDPQLGWIHTIAHGGDLLWRLALHPGSTAHHQTAILDALGTQITRLDTPPFIFNEADRLARVVSAVLGRSELTQDAVAKWIAEVADSDELESWGEAFGSQNGMAKLHNTKHFLRALREQLDISETSASDRSRSAIQQIDTLLSGLP